MDDVSLTAIQFSTPQNSSHSSFCVARSKNYFAKTGKVFPIFGKVFPILEKFFQNRKSFCVARSKKKFAAYQPDPIYIVTLM